ncbi:MULTISPECIES: NAD(P)-dependent oxidoreductase [Mycobacterium]|uniref:6-phosphogluconate dehydrogenase n=1 Tax=Mycobacterium kiyosense TaxID=2871094 RepID=A0A9P3UZB6_9MYCO|nr:MULTISPECIES: NAD(P)-dependent oxidoreductase [Mycobacterium]BDB41148.1 6-phosphogluconate dehydrogenase [Mycobacterium kiyosense]BDE12936.1 6-phosphogluconate dehydrogenase [Mycobacterium sp. 20KCMC460]GLB83621.1 6-phosphogluconate dehydrogenase [Mycobacterium kiyosense]GLB91528.1 6-phosphogluconate dehydrogenase [Mycobacterium kiyosense]GLB97497.1 6-phosphogluconate dehydrogenase [Mycobacterium kiyosense]
MTGLRIGFVGLGSQGGPMARRIIEDGFPTTLWARRPESLKPYDGSGAHYAADRRALGTASDVLCLCVVGDVDVDEVLRGDDGALATMAPGSIVVIHSTVHPETCRRLQKDYPAIHFVDAPVSGGGHAAAARSLLVMVGGDDEPIARCRPVLDTFADPVVRLGPLGAGQAAKLLNNSLFTAQLGLAASTFAVARDLGVDLDALTEILSTGSARSYAAEVIANSGHTLAVMAELAGTLLAKDVGILTDVVGDQPPPELIRVAAATIAAMQLDGR